MTKLTFIRILATVATGALFVLLIVFLARIEHLSDEPEITGMTFPLILIAGVFGIPALALSEYTDLEYLRLVPIWAAIFVLVWIFFPVAILTIFFLLSAIALFGRIVYKLGRP
ncbi:MAG: hypothetical protein NUV82_01055 [Candidatus Komeilibacteria bacterium]|nr:hypothetical protein [Candidatus Komeilibacteria bacterium]